MTPGPLALEVARLVSLLEGHYGAQSRLAKRVNLTTSAITSWKQMKSVPDEDRWPAIEDYFGLPEGHLESVDDGLVEVGAVEPTRVDGLAILTNRSATPIEARLDALEDRLAEILTTVQGASQHRSDQLEAIASAVEANGTLLRSLVDKVREIRASPPAAPSRPPVRPSERTDTKVPRDSRSGGDRAPRRGVGR